MSTMHIHVVTKDERGVEKTFILEVRNPDFVADPHPGGDTSEAAYAANCVSLRHKRLLMSGMLIGAMAHHRIRLRPIEQEDARG